MEYEVHFYSSGALEEDWKPKDLPENLMVASFGSIFVAIAAPLGKLGLLVVLLGTLACLAGAAVETMLSVGYNICQFYNRPWGKNQAAGNVRVFTASWVAALVVAALLVLSGFRPLQLVNISVIFGMVVMPFTYYPILRVAMDRGVMGKHVNSRVDTAIGIVFLVLIVVAALAAIPLMMATNSGKP